MPLRTGAAALVFACLHEGANAITFRNAVSEFPSFDAFIQENGRAYALSSSEYNIRREIYQRHVAEAAEHNAKPSRSWTARANEYWDWSDEELASLSGARSTAAMKKSAGIARPGFLQQQKGGKRSIDIDLFGDSTSDLPAQVSWTNVSALGHIRKQGACGSCWAVAAVTVLDAHAEIHTGHQRFFSAQQIVSCMPNPQECGGQGGCRGATAGMAFDWVMKNGCAEEHDVPYQAQDTPCTMQPNMPSAATGLVQDDEPAANANLGGAAFGMTGWNQLPENKYDELLRALATLGPVAVSVAANSGWHHYGFGIFDSCSKDAIMNHAVVAVGYGAEGDKKYWQIQNSWGRGWGEGGRMRLLRHDDEEMWCGTDDKPELGSACKPYPDAVTVCGTCGVLYDSVVPHFQAV
eukprot:TRINITY_DN47232_c0_g3_i2.p1 TRINITY_DN47232_c0_g3~~TRINITY_DN47232_c0_g3_i2.p1  ORF type:complete len:442 (+),score=89.97 TRINITY_DN47232_c0_g3_i2:108-1328(+)